MRVFDCFRLLLIATFFVSFGCSKNNDAKPAPGNEVFSSSGFTSVSYVSAKAEIASDGQTISINVNDKVAGSWIVSVSYPDQTVTNFLQIDPLNISKSGAGTIQIASPANPGKKERKAVVTVTYGGNTTFTIDVLQPIVKYNATVKYGNEQVLPNNELILNNDSHDDTVTVTVSPATTVEYIVPVGSFFNITTDNGKVIVHAPENPGLTGRNGKVYIWGGTTDRELIDSIMVIQGSNLTDAETPLSISFAGNTYTTSGNNLSIPSSAGGTFNFSNVNSTASTYFKVSKSGTLNLGLIASPTAATKIKVTVLGKEFVVPITTSATNKYCPLGTVTINSPGYVKVDFQVMSNPTRAGLKYLKIGGVSTTATNTWVTDARLNESGSNWQYWGRRGASVHFNYADGWPVNTEYFYNEVTVPAGNDVIGSYFMTNGFDGGYCGIQVNSATERRILFSVWADYDTQDASQIPADLKIKMLRKGSGVTIGEFGNEGAGGQSYMVFPWKAGVTYKILTQVKYVGVVGSRECTNYTAYFFDPEQNKWMLIASLQRPAKSSSSAIKSYTGAYSFLENFNPEQGWITREVNFGNQWTRNTTGSWSEITRATFTNDATAGAGIRLDYYGGLESNKFKLKSFGFFNTNTTYGTKFTRTANGTTPTIDLTALEALTN